MADNEKINIDTSTFTKATTPGSIDKIYGETLPRIYEKQLSVHSDYLVYFDNVLMNDYVLSYTTNIGINAGIGTASVALIYTPAFRSISISGTVEDGIENGTQLRIFVNNIFSGKYKLIFDGIIKQRMLSRDSSGFQLTFSAVDYLYWMNKISAPISIPLNQAISPGERLKWKAQSIDPDKTAKVEISSAGSMKNKNVREYFDNLKEKSFSNSKVYSEPNSTANFDDVIDRVEIMGDINKELTKYQVIDFVVNSNSVFADTVYVAMSNTANNLMMEFYQDRDGIVRIKPPFWNEPVLKNHVIDPMMIISSSETTDWTKMYTRVIVTGGVEEWMPESGSTATKVDLLTPVGVYLGSLSDKGKAKWADYTSEDQTPSAYGTVYVDDNGNVVNGGSGGSVATDVPSDVRSKTKSEKMAWCFPSGEPKNTAQARQYLATANITIRDKSGNTQKRTLQVHKSIVKDVESIFSEIYNSGFCAYDVGSFREWEVLGGGTVSQHCYGLAIDINPTENYMIRNGSIVAGSFWNPGSNKYSMAADGPCVKAFKAHGWDWGGNWRNSKDYMHFSFCGG